MPRLRGHLDTATGSERGLSSPQQCSNAEAAPKTGETLDISRVAADWKVRAPGQKKDWRPACAGRQKPNPRSRSAPCQRHNASSRLKVGLFAPTMMAKAAGTHVTPVVLDCVCSHGVSLSRTDTNLSQAPNKRLQASGKHQFPNSRLKANRTEEELELGIWSFSRGWCLGLEVVLCPFSGKPVLE